jgi:hypothetical protein
MSSSEIVETNGFSSLAMKRSSLYLEKIGFVFRVGVLQVYYKCRSKVWDSVEVKCTTSVEVKCGTLDKRYTGNFSKE